MINTVTILKNVRLNHKLLIKAVRTLNTYAETADAMALETPVNEPAE